MSCMRESLRTKEGCMVPSSCPLCGKLGCLRAEAQSGPEAVRYWCQAHCGTFRMGTMFLKCVWPAVQNEDKKAIAAYMHTTKGPQRLAPLIQGDNYREYITQGRTLQKRAGAGALAVAKERREKGARA